jgi:hypothetical protein
VSQLTELALYGYKAGECAALLPLLTNLRQLTFHEPLEANDMPEFGGVVYPHMRTLNLDKFKITANKFAAMLASMPALTRVSCFRGERNRDESLRVMLLAQQHGVQRMVVPREAVLRDLFREHREELRWIEIVF